jgi:hypothetical protein
MIAGHDKIGDKKIRRIVSSRHMRCTSAHDSARADWPTAFSPAEESLRGSRVGLYPKYDVSVDELAEVLMQVGELNRHNLSRFFAPASGAHADDCSLQGLERWLGFIVRAMWKYRSGKMRPGIRVHRHILRITSAVFDGSFIGKSKSGLESVTLWKHLNTNHFFD